MNTNDKMQPTYSASRADERAKFEAWMNTCELDESPNLDRDGEYYEQWDVQRVWRGWQAAIAAIVPPVVQAPIDCDRMTYDQLEQTYFAQCRLTDEIADKLADGSDGALLSRISELESDLAEMNRRYIAHTVSKVQPIVPSDENYKHMIDLLYKICNSDNQQSRCANADLLGSKIRMLIAAPIVATVPSEPVAWMVHHKESKPGEHALHGIEPTWLKEMGEFIVTPLYAAPSPTEQASDARNADCYSHNDGDSWCDCPDDIVFVHGLKVGDEYEVLASVRAWTERYRVTKAPDDDSDDYEVERVATPADKGNAP